LRYMRASPSLRHSSVRHRDVRRQHDDAEIDEPGPPGLEVERQATAKPAGRFEQLSEVYLRCPARTTDLHIEPWRDADPDVEAEPRGGEKRVRRHRATPLQRIRGLELHLVDPASDSTADEHREREGAAWAIAPLTRQRRLDRARGHTLGESEQHAAKR